MRFFLPQKKPISKNRQIKREVKHTRSLVQVGERGVKGVKLTTTVFNLTINSSVSKDTKIIIIGIFVVEQKDEREEGEEEPLNQPPG